MLIAVAESSLPVCILHSLHNSWLILVLRPANERRRYKVMPSLIGLVQT